MTEACFLFSVFKSAFKESPSGQEHERDTQGSSLPEAGSLNDKRTGYGADRD